MLTAKQKATRKHQKEKLTSIKFDFNKEKDSDIEAMEKFNELSMMFSSKKEAFIYLINNVKLDT